MKAQPGTDTPCQWCGEPVLRFCEEQSGLWILLESTPLPITSDLMDPCLRNRVYQLSESVGWHRKFAPAGRNWRELRKVHECPQQPRQRRY